MTSQHDGTWKGKVRSECRCQNFFVIASCLVSIFCVISLPSSVGFCACYVHLHTLYVRLISSGFSFCDCFVWILFLFGFGGHIRHASFPVYFTLLFFLHYSCSVVVSYFWFIPPFVILLFQLPCSIYVCVFKFLWKNLNTCSKRVQI